MSSTAPAATATPAPEPKSRGRGVIAWVLVVIASILLPLAVIAFWGQRTITDTDRYIATVGPLGTDPAIKDAIVNKTTATLVEAVKENDGVNEALSTLPPIAANKLEPIILGAMQSLITQVATKIVDSPKFETFWVEINKQAQQALIKALSGDTSGPVSVSGGEVVLDTSVVAEDVKNQLVDRGLTFLKDKQLPASMDQNVVLLKSDEVKQAQLIYKFSVPVARWLIPLVGLLFVIAVLVSRRRARLLMGIGIGIVLGVGVLSVGLGIGKTYLSTAAPNSQAQSVLNAFWLALSKYLATAVSAFITLGVIIALIAWFGGRSAPATKLRGYISATLRRAGAKVQASWIGGPASFLAKHWRAAFIVVALLGVVALFAMSSISMATVIWTSVICLAVAAIIYLITGAASATGSAVTAADDGPADTSPTVVMPTKT